MQRKRILFGFLLMTILSLNLGSVAMSAELPRSKVQKVERQGLLDYYLYLPKHVNESTRVLVSVHGISRNARIHALRFASLAEQYGVIVVAPYFSEHRFPDYQRLGRSGRGQRADKALNNMLSDVARLTGVTTDKVYMFGYSGGAQFVHRYMMAYPERVASAVLGAAGWYTFPDDSIQFPYGLKSNKRLPDLRFEQKLFLQVPVSVLVGDADTERDAALRKSERLDSMQGTTRLERARRWVMAMSASAKQYGLGTEYRVSILPNSDHSFTRSIKHGAMAEHVFDFLFEPQIDQENASLFSARYAESLSRWFPLAGEAVPQKS